MDNQLDQALKYHKMGLNTIPLYRPGEQHKNKVSDGKNPRVKIKPYFHRLQSVKEIEKIFTLAEENNIGIIAGIPSKNLVILDFDSRKKYLELYQKNPFFRWIADNTIITKSYRGVHVWIFVDVPTKTSKNSELKLDIKGQSSYAVEPHSIYKRGYQIGEYLFEQLNEILKLPIADLSFLGVEAAPFADHRWMDLGYKHYSILQGEKAGYDSRSEAEFSFVLNQISNGESFEYVLELFNRLAADNTHFRQHKDSEQYLQITYDNALEVYPKKLRKFDRNILQAIQITKTLSFRTHSDQAILLCILQKSRETGKQFLDLSCRDLAERANLSKDTASNSLKRLQEAGFIHKELDGHYDQAARYALNIESICPKSDTPAHLSSCMVCPDMGTSNPVRDMGNDVFAYRGLGKTGWLLIQFLNENVGRKLKLSEIVSGSGISRTTVMRKLEDFEGFFEIERRSRTTLYTLTRRVEKADLEKIAEIKGVAGRKEKMKRRHRQEREGYKEYLAYEREMQNRRNVS